MLAGSCDEGLLDEKGYFDVVKAGVLHIVRYPEPVYISPERYVEGIYWRIPQMFPPEKAT